MKKSQITPLTDEDIERIRQESAEADRSEPRALAVRYDAAIRSIVLLMRGGATLTVPIASLRGLDGVTDEELAGVGVFDNGADIEWPELDVQMTVMSIMHLALGIITPSESARRAGSTKSVAKAQAAARNGAKGGRPRKSLAA